MEIRKVIFMVEIMTDEVDEEGNKVILQDEVMEDDLVNFIINNTYGVSIVGHYFVEFSTGKIIELEDTIEELEDENQNLKDRLDNIQSTLDDALSYLSQVESEIDSAYEECDYE